MSSEFERLNEALSVLKGIHQDQAIARAEFNLLDTPDADQLPVPGSCHPALAHAADFVRKFNQPLVRVMPISSRRSMLMATHDKTRPTTIENNILVLIRKSYIGLAPYVGDPSVSEAHYLWYVWFDDYGRSIAGEVALIWNHNKEN